MFPVIWRKDHHYPNASSNLLQTEVFQKENPFCFPMAIRRILKQDEFCETGFGKRVVERILVDDPVGSGIVAFNKIHSIPRINREQEIIRSA